jgi:hypothetical protein
MSNAPQDPNADYPQQSSSGARTVIIVLIVVVVLVIGLCACGAGALYFGLDTIQSVAGEELKEQLVGNPVLEEELGEDFTMEMDIMETANRAQKNPDQAERIVFNVEGSKGKGKLIAEPGSGRNELRNVQLEMEDGRVIDVPTGGDALQEGDVDLGDAQPAGDVTNEEAEPATNENGGDGGAEADAPAGAGAGN